MIAPSNAAADTAAVVCPIATVALCARPELVAKSMLLAALTAVSVLVSAVSALGESGGGPDGQAEPPSENCGEIMIAEADFIAWGRELMTRRVDGRR